MLFCNWQANPTIENGQAIFMAPDLRLLMMLKGV
jgi:hypothetical protein